MRRIFTLCLALAVLGLPFRAAAAPPGPDAEDARVSVFFDSDCEAEVIRAIREAHHEVLVAAFLLTRDDIIAALIRAAKGGRRVTVKYDAEQAKYEGMENALRRLRKARVRCTAIRPRAKGASMHHKFVVVDDAVVLAGSYNFTTLASTVNRENVLRIESPAIARRFRAAFDGLDAK